MFVSLNINAVTTVEQDLSGMYGWSGTFDSSTLTATYAAQWDGMGVWLGGVDWSDYSTLTMEWDTQETSDVTGLKLIVQYYDAENELVDGSILSDFVDYSEGIASIELDEDYKDNVAQWYIQSDAAGTVTFIKAYLTLEEEEDEEETESSEISNKIDLNDLASFGSAGYESTYDEEEQSITFSGQYKGRGWWFDSIDLSEYDYVYVSVKAADDSVTWAQIIIEYNNTEVEATTANTTINSTDYTGITAALDETGKSDVMQIYIQNNNPGTIYVDEAYLYAAEDDEDEDDDDEETGISSIVSDETTNAVYYDLTGKKVSTPSTGLYIKKSIDAEGNSVVKKVIIK